MQIIFRNYSLIIGASNEEKSSTQSIDFYFDDLTWCVRKSDLIQPWRRFFLIGSWETWMLAAIGLYVNAAIFYLFFRYYHHQENFTYCTGMSMLTMFSVPIPYNPTHGIARIHCGISLIYGMLCVILINCYLTSLMTKPQFQYQIRTVDDLMYYQYKMLVDVEAVSLEHLGNDEV